jgi:site-specific DNA-methyltransferase (adenine-specific)
MYKIKDINNKIHHAECLEFMRKMPSNKIDTIISDVPYGLKFMGKKWDYDVPSVKVFKEMLRVAKPGATALIFAGARTQHKIATNIEDAGWVLKDVIMWIMGSGFPKATDISKQLDKKAGKEKKYKKQKKIIDKNLFEDEIEIEEEMGIYREEIDWDNCNYNVGINGKDDRRLLEPQTSEAKLWNGWKSHGLKPAYEPIIVAMKPNEGSYSQNALKYGVSGLNIDGGRIGDFKPTQGSAQIYQSNKWQGKRKEYPVPNHQGRFPANIILDQEAAKLLDEQSGECRSSGIFNRDLTAKNNWMKKNNKCSDKMYNDKGGASRFFKVIKI